MTDVRTVNDNIFLLGLDSLFRASMKRVESGELLECAETLASEVGCKPDEGPVEGYYHESPELTRYFRLMRALQACDAGCVDRVRSKPAYERLSAVCRSSIFGAPVGSGLLPRTADVVSRALEATAPHWKLGDVLKEARRLSSLDDHSLVGMACSYGSPPVVVALRESVALYAAVAFGMAAPGRPSYRWEVSPELERAARRFVQGAHTDIGIELPLPCAENASIYWDACADQSIVGRCIAVGCNDAEVPNTYYHWAIRELDGELTVEEFWDTELWTTEKYLSKAYRPD